MYEQAYSSMVEDQRFKPYTAALIEENKGKVYWRMGRPKDAIHSFAECLRLSNRTVLATFIDCL